MSAAQGLAWRLSPAKSHRASRSWLSAPQRKLTTSTLPDWRVGGAAAGPAGKRAGGGEPAAGVADLGEQSGGADAARAGEAGEDRGVGVQVELFADAGGHRLDLGGEGAQDGDERGGDRGGGVGGRASGAGRG